MTQSQLSTMLYSLLISGGCKEERLDRALTFVKEQKIAACDTTYLSDETLIGINKIRRLLRTMNLSPLHSIYKAAIIHPAENLTKEAQQALLKTLEEPPVKTIFILTSQSPELLLPTVVSRCQLVNLPQTSPPPADWLKRLIFLSQIGEKTVATLLFDAYLFSKTKEEAASFIEETIAVCHLWLLYQNRVRLPTEIIKEREKLFATVTRNQLIKIINHLQIGRRGLKINVNPRLTLENLFFNVTAHIP